MLLSRPSEESASALKTCKATSQAGNVNIMFKLMSHSLQVSLHAAKALPRPCITAPRLWEYHYGKKQPTGGPCLWHPAGPA